MDDRERKYSVSSQISGSMKQCTAVIRALAPDPEVLLRDEPFGVVDYPVRHNLLFF